MLLKPPSLVYFIPPSPLNSLPLVHLPKPTSSFQPPCPINPPFPNHPIPEKREEQLVPGSSYQLRYTAEDDFGTGSAVIDFATGAVAGPPPSVVISPPPGAVNYAEPVRLMALVESSAPPSSLRGQWKLVDGALAGGATTLDAPGVMLSELSDPLLELAAEALLPETLYSLLYIVEDEFGAGSALVKFSTCQALTPPTVSIASPAAAVNPAKTLKLTAAVVSSAPPSSLRGKWEIVSGELTGGAGLDAQGVALGPLTEPVLLLSAGALQPGSSLRLAYTAADAYGVGSATVDVAAIAEPADAEAAMEQLIQSAIEAGKSLAAAEAAAEAVPLSAGRSRVIAMFQEKHRDGLYFTFPEVPIAGMPCTFFFQPSRSRVQAIREGVRFIVHGSYNVPGKGASRWDAEQLFDVELRRNPELPGWWSHTFNVSPVATELNVAFWDPSTGERGPLHEPLYIPLNISLMYTPI